MTDQSRQLIEAVKQEFDVSNEFSEPSAWRVYIHYMIKTGLVLYNDTCIKHESLTELIESGKVKSEGEYFHQGEKCIRYRFTGYKYPNKFYRSIPKDLKKSIMDRDNHSCVYCNAYYYLQIDHITPWSMGGYTEYNNLQVLCRKCNSTKRNN